MADPIEMTLPDGTVASVPRGTTGLEIAQSIGERLAAAAIVVKVDGEQFDVSRPLEKGGSFEVVTDSSKEGRFVIRHSAAHVLAQAVLDKFPGAAYAIGPPIDDGFYYDFDVGRAFTPDDLDVLDARVQEIIAEDQPFERTEISRDEGAALFADQPYKTEIITKGEATQIVYYWFQQRDRLLINEFLVKWYLFWDAVSRNRTDGALVRVMTPIIKGEDEAQADRRLIDLIRSVYPRLGPYFPST